MKNKGASKMIGDNKLPNYYWVFVSNDYLAQNDINSNSWEWIGDYVKFQSKGYFIERFETLKEALSYIKDNLSIGMDYKDIKINRITIEDRLSGEIYHATKFMNLVTAEISIDSHLDTSYTEMEIKKRNAIFE